MRTECRRNYQTMLSGFYPVCISFIFTLFTYSMTANHVAAQNSAPPTAATVSAQYLTAMVGDQGPSSTGFIATYGFGAAFVGASASIQHRFYVRNDTSGPITIDRLMPSCGCTSAVVSQALPILLSPGSKMPIDVSVDLSGIGSGRIAKSVSVHTVGQLQPAAILLITGTILQQVSVTPTRFDFGTLPPHGKRSIVFTVHIDPSFAPKELNAQVGAVSAQVVDRSNFVLKTVPLPLDSSVLPDDQVTETDAKLPVSYTFILELVPHSRSGIFNGNLSIKLDSGRTIDAANVFLTVPISGELASGLTAKPDVINFGTVISGQTAKANFILSGLSNKECSATKLETMPLLSATWTTPVQPAHTRTAPNSKLITVALSPDAPIGHIESEISISTRSGIDLVLPVIANVVAK